MLAPLTTKAMKKSTFQKPDAKKEKIYVYL